MKNELGKWLMDISKYIITAVIISALLGNIEDTATMILFSAIVAVTTLATGLKLINSSTQTKKKTKIKNRK